MGLLHAVLLWLAVGQMAAGQLEVANDTIGAASSAAEPVVLQGTTMSIPTINVSEPTPLVLEAPPPATRLEERRQRMRARIASELTTQGGGSGTRTEVGTMKGS